MNDGFRADSGRSKQDGRQNRQILRNAREGKAGKGNNVAYTL